MKMMIVYRNVINSLLVIPTIGEKQKQKRPKQSNKKTSFNTIIANEAEIFCI